MSRSGSEHFSRRTSSTLHYKYQTPTSFSTSTVGVEEKASDSHSALTSLKWRTASKCFAPSSYHYPSCSSSDFALLTLALLKIVFQGVVPYGMSSAIEPDDAPESYDISMFDDDLCSCDFCSSETTPPFPECDNDSSGTDWPGIGSLVRLVEAMGDGVQVMTSKRSRVSEILEPVAMNAPKGGKVTRNTRSSFSPNCVP